MGFNKFYVRSILQKIRKGRKTISGLINFVFHLSIRPVFWFGHSNNDHHESYKINRNILFQLLYVFPFLTLIGVLPLGIHFVYKIR
jgi:hypothetical protein